MNPFIALAAAMAISMVVIPLVSRIAPRLGMIDRPNARKVHTAPVARVGGWGIALGALAPVLLGVSFDPLIAAYVFGSLVLLAFGAVDDCHDIGHWGKFVGQFIAVLPVVFYADLYVQRLPFLDSVLPPAVGIPFTVFAMVGVINAINHSDGLDGLAGGESLLSLLAIALLAHLYEGVVALTIAVAALGGIVGFLRFNTHPARIFMGDSGSQFLGFSLGFLAVLLTQRVNPALSPALPALLLGLPIIDILAVLAQRMRGGMNWFEATRNHIHHRLLDLGFDHYEVVIVIYSIQAVLVVSGVYLCYQSDALILATYAGVCGTLFLLIRLAERSGWRVNRERRLSALVQAVKGHPVFIRGPNLVIGVMICAYFLFGSFWVSVVPRDFGVMSLVLFVVLLAEVFFGNQNRSVIVRGTIYATATFVVYLTIKYPGGGFAALGPVEPGFFLVLAGAVWLTIRESTRRVFTTTPMDYLIVFVVIAIGLFSTSILPGPELRQLGLLVVRIMIILYGCEVLINTMKKRSAGLSLACLGALGVLGLRGLLW